MKTSTFSDVLAEKQREGEREKKVKHLINSTGEREKRTTHGSVCCEESHRAKDVASVVRTTASLIYRRRACAILVVTLCRLYLKPLNDQQALGPIRWISMD
jgi:hypothetical protein